MVLYPTLIELPGTRVDRYGNLLLKRNDDMRKRWAFVVRVKHFALVRTSLVELLNWLRWGGETGVMWECTVEELFRVVDRWEAANPGASREDYGLHGQGMSRIEIRTFWTCQARALEASIRYRCSRCNVLFPVNHMFCRECDGRRSHAVKELWGPRGKGSYNFALQGADGYGIARFAWATRGKTRPIPTVLSIQFEL